MTEDQSLNPLRIGAGLRTLPAKRYGARTPTASLNPLRIGAGLRTNSIFSGFWSLPVGLNPLRIGAGLRTFGVMLCAMPFFARSQSPSHRGGSSHRRGSCSSHTTQLLCLNPLRIGAGLRTCLCLAATQIQVYRLNPLRIGAGLRTRRRNSLGSLGNGWSQSPSHRGGSWHKSNPSYWLALGETRLNPLRIGAGLGTVWSRSSSRSAAPPSQSPSHRGGSWHEQMSIEVGRAVRIPSQSPSHRGGSWHLTMTQRSGDVPVGLNPLRIGAGLRTEK